MLKNDYIVRTFIEFPPDTKTNYRTYDTQVSIKHIHNLDQERIEIIPMSNYCVPFDFDGKNYIFIDFIKENERQIRLYNLDSKQFQIDLLIENFKENIKQYSLQVLRSLIQSSSEMNGCPITNILEKEIKSIWLSDESLPQEIILNLNKSNFIHFPKKLSAIGIYCWHAYSTNPKLIEVLISTNNKNDSNINFMSLGDFDLGLKPGMQLLHLDEDLLDTKLNDNDNISI